MVIQVRLKKLEVKIVMLLDYSEHCYVRSIALMAVETCSKAILTVGVGHGKSPCFLRCSFLAVVGVDYALLVLAFVNVEDFLDCAF
jgi:hypothetical protein